MLKHPKNLKKVIKSWLPPAFFNLLSSKTFHDWSGEYTTWEDALKASTGYDNKLILEKVKEALLKVKNGEAVYERDSVLFGTIQYSWPLLAALMWVAAQNDGKLNIIDFGGSLGSSYFQNKKFLFDLCQVHWHVVEQKHFVRCGKEYFEDEELKFYETIEDSLSEKKSDVILFSSVLQYLEKPYRMIDNIMAHKFQFIVFDRTPYHRGINDLLYVHHVHQDIFKASYPTWIFSLEKFKNYFTAYELVTDFCGFENEIKDLCSFKGFIFKRK